MKMGSFINEELMRTALDGEDGEIKIDAKVPPTYANAINVHKKKEKDIAKELKDKKNELKKPFLGVKGKTTIIPKTQEMKKLHLSESLFDSPRSLGEHYNAAPDVYAGIFRVLDNMEHIINYINNLDDEGLCYSDMQQSYDVLEEAMMEFSDYLIELKSAETGKVTEAVAAPVKPEKRTRENRKADLFDRVYAELDGSQKGIESRYRIFNVKASKRYHYEDVSVGYTPSLHIEVLADSEERLDFAKQVADAYGLKCEIVHYTSKFATKPYAARVFIPDEMYESVRGKKLRESDSSGDLRKRAMDAYKARNYQFFHDLTDDELVTLQTSCQMTDENPWGAAYDDEVFDAIAVRPNSQELFNRATEITIRKMSLNQVVRIYRGITGLNNDNEFSEEELRDYVINALREDLNNGNSLKESIEKKYVDKLLDKVQWCNSRQDLEDQGADLSGMSDEDIQRIFDGDVTEEDIEKMFGGYSFVDDDFDLTEDYNYHSAIGKYFEYNIPHNVAEVFSELVERAIENSADGQDLSEAIMEAIDEGLIYHKDIWAVKSFYEGSELSDEAYEQLRNDLYSIVDSLSGNEDDV